MPYAGDPKSTRDNSPGHDRTNYIPALGAEMKRFDGTTEGIEQSYSSLVVGTLAGNLLMVDIVNNVS